MKINAKKKIYVLLLIATVLQGNLTSLNAVPCIKTPYTHIPKKIAKERASNPHLDSLGLSIQRKSL